MHFTTDQPHSEETADCYTARWYAVIGGLVGIRTLTLNQLTGTRLFYEQMSAFRKSHGVFERPERVKAFARAVRVNARFYRSL